MPKCTRFMLGTREGGGWHRRTLAGLVSDGTCARKNAQGKLANFLSGTLLGLWLGLWGKDWCSFGR